MRSMDAIFELFIIDHMRIVVKSAAFQRHLLLRERAPKQTLTTTSGLRTHILLYNTAYPLLNLDIKYISTMSAAVGVQRTSVPLDENEDVATENLSAKTRYALLVRGGANL
jgi:hypothetical protein